MKSWKLSLCDAEWYMNANCCVMWPWIHIFHSVYLLLKANLLMGKAHSNVGRVPSPLIPFEWMVLRSIVVTNVEIEPLLLDTCFVHFQKISYLWHVHFFSTFIVFIRLFWRFCDQFRPESLWFLHKHIKWCPHGLIFDTFRPFSTYFIPFVSIRFCLSSSIRVICSKILIISVQFLCNFA